MKFVQLGIISPNNKIDMTSDRRRCQRVDMIETITVKTTKTIVEMDTTTVIQCTLTRCEGVVDPVAMEIVTALMNHIMTVKLIVLCIMETKDENQNFTCKFLY